MESLDKLAGEERQHCQSVTDHGLDRPPGLFIRSMQKEMSFSLLVDGIHTNVKRSTIFHRVVFDQLFRRTMVAANASTKLPEQEQPVRKIMLETPIAIATTVFTSYVSFRTAGFEKRIWEGIYWVFVSAWLTLPVLASISWHTAFSPSQVTADDIYLLYCNGLRLEGKLDIKDCDVFLQMVGQNISYSLYDLLLLVTIPSGLTSLSIALRPMLRDVLRKAYRRVPSDDIERSSYVVTREILLPSASANYLPNRIGQAWFREMLPQ